MMAAPLILIIPRMLKGSCLSSWLFSLGNFGMLWIYWHQKLALLFTIATNCKPIYVMTAFQFHHHPHDHPKDHYTHYHHHHHSHPYQSLAPRHKAQTGLRAAFLMLRSSRWGLLSAQISLCAYRSYIKIYPAGVCILGEVYCCLITTCAYRPVWTAAYTTRKLWYTLEEFPSLLQYTCCFCFHPWHWRSLWFQCEALEPIYIVHYNAE